eukprot:gene5413-5426_t
MALAAKIEEHLKRAKKASKGGFFSKPDWDAAAADYEAAGNMLHSMKNYKEAKQ